MRKSVILGLGVSLLLGSTWCVDMPGLAKDAKWTITERQEQLDKEIAAGQKAGELTLKEANSLKEDSDKITQKIRKFKEKNAGKLSYDNINAVEKALNKLSLRIQKLKLAKRVQ